jgi:UDP-2,3-diacylglucosamine pyrophosphatase LpxH
MPRPRWHVDEGLKKYATETQKKYIDAVNEHMGISKAARALGLAMSTVRGAIQAVEEKAAICGYAPGHDMTHEVPSPFVVKGVSTYYDKDGKVSGQWVKSKVDESQAIETVKAFIDSLVSEAKGLSPVVKSPKQSLDDLLAVYPFGDPHFGMYAWAQEAGDDFDLEVAERLTLGAVDTLVSAAPAAAEALLLLLGDVFHANDQTNQTPGHKHQLDVDSRYPKVILSGIKTFKHAILRALEKHPRVKVWIKPGNHDPQAIWSLTFALAAYFENNDRVEIEINPSKFSYYRFGKVLIGSTHGDTVKHAQLPGIMAADQAEDWGLAKHRYWYTGHVHHTQVNEFPGVVCESFRTLAAKDAYAAGHGYRAGRDMRAIILHKEYGEVGRHRCDISMLEAA